MCKSLLVLHCNYVSVSYCFWDIQRQIMAWPWNLGQISLIVIENSTIRKIWYGFLFALHRNYSFSRFDTIHERHGQTVTDTETDTAQGTSKVEYAYNFWKCAYAFYRKLSKSVFMLVETTACQCWLVFLRQSVEVNFETWLDEEKTPTFTANSRRDKQWCKQDQILKTKTKTRTTRSRPRPKLTRPRPRSGFRTMAVRTIHVLLIIETVSFQCI